MIASIMLLTAESITNIVTSSVTTTLLLSAGAVAFWRYLLQGGFGAHFEVEASPCRIRQLSSSTGTYMYTICFNVKNNSNQIHVLKQRWRKLRLPSEVGPEYNPDAALVFHQEAEVTDRLGAGLGAYQLLPGEMCQDHVVKVASQPEEVCFLEFAFEYRVLSRWWGPIPWTKSRYYSQILVAPVEREDLLAVSVSGGRRNAEQES